MKKALLALSILALISSTGFSAALVQVSGGGNNGDPLIITLPQDITLQVNSGGSIGGYRFGFEIPVFSSSDGYNYAALGSTSGFTYQTDPNASVATSTIAWTQSVGQTLRVYFASTPQLDEVLINPGGSITFKAGTVLGANYGQNGFNILSNPGATYTLTESSFYTETEAYGYDASSVSLVPEPSASELSVS
jgi:hypothetical protein